jgi:hypothetical protein
MERSTREPSGSFPAAEQRKSADDRPIMAGVPVREEDIESVKAIRTIARLFRGMAIILIVLMVLQVIFALSSTVDLSPGIVVADAVRLTIFAGLLWGMGDLAVLAVKSHFDMRATRILTARIAHMMRTTLEASGSIPKEGAGSRADRET